MASPRASVCRLRSSAGLFHAIRVRMSPRTRDFITWRALKEMSPLAIEILRTACEESETWLFSVSTWVGTTSEPECMVAAKPRVGLFGTGLNVSYPGMAPTSTSCA